MGTETNRHLLAVLFDTHVHVKLNNPQMGTETRPLHLCEQNRERIWLN